MVSSTKCTSKKLSPVPGEEGAAEGPEPGACARDGVRERSWSREPRGQVGKDCRLSPAPGFSRCEKRLTGM